MSRSSDPLGSVLAIGIALAVSIIAPKITGMRRAAAQRDRMHAAQDEIAETEEPSDSRSPTAATEELGVSWLLPPPTAGAPEVTATAMREPGQSSAPAIAVGTRSRPRLLINGRPADDKYNDAMGQLRLAPHEVAVDATLIDADDAAAGFGRQMKWAFAALYIIVGGGLLAIALFAGTPMESAAYTPYVLLLLIVWTVAMPLGYGYNMRKFRGRIDRVNLPAPPGAEIHLDGRGLSIAGRATMPWSALSIDTVEFTRALARYSSFYVIDGLFLAVQDETIELHRNALTNGHVFLDNVFERLCPVY